MPPAPARARLTPVPLTLVPFADKVCVPIGCTVCAGTDIVMVPPLAFVLPVKDSAPTALNKREFPVNAVVLAVLPERLKPVKFDVPL